MINTDASAQKMRKVFEILSEIAPELEVEGEMHGDAALDENIRHFAFPNSRFKGSANLLIMPNLDAANISFNLLKSTSGNNVTIGPILLGCSKTSSYSYTDCNNTSFGQYDGIDCC